jgi:hypothetical protein
MALRAMSLTKTLLQLCPPQAPHWLPLALLC